MQLEPFLPFDLRCVLLLDIGVPEAQDSGMFNTIGLAAMFLTPHASLITPPAPVAVVAPAPVVVTPAPAAITPPPVIAAPKPPTMPAVSAPPPPVPMPTVTPTTVISSVECVVTVTDPYGNAVTMSPGQADASGSCAAYATGWPTGDIVSVTPQSTTVTAGGPGVS